MLRDLISGFRPKARVKKIFAVTNQKGGVGKTTTAINLAASVALADRRVLIVDMDPQGNLTSGVGLKGSVPEGRTVYDALTAAGEPDVGRFIVPTAVTGLSLMPADRNLAGAEVEMDAPQRTHVSEVLDHAVQLDQWRGRSRFLGRPCRGVNRI